VPQKQSKPDTYIPYKPIKLGRQDGGLTTQQQHYLQTFIARYTARTSGSKAWTQEFRPVFAENRASAGFQRVIKEMLYPIVGVRSRGAYLWDIDGNKYLDIAMGFGSILFGHLPPFIEDALQQQLPKGIQLGPQSELAGKVAELIAEFTGLIELPFVTQVVRLSWRPFAWRGQQQGVTKLPSLPVLSMVLLMGLWLVPVISMIL
jgi:hypothetical protein